MCSVTCKGKSLEREGAGKLKSVWYRFAGSSYWTELGVEVDMSQEANSYGTERLEQTVQVSGWNSN